MEAATSQKKLLLTVSLKYGLIAVALVIVLMIIQTVTFNPDLMALTWIHVILDLIIFIICVGLAHLEYNRKNEHFISFMDTIVIGLIIIGIYFVIVTILSGVNQSLFLKEKMQAYLKSKAADSDFSPMINSGYIILGSLAAGIGMLLFQIVVLFYLITMEAQWKIFKKAGRKGWESLIPIYNIIIFIKICQKPGWWFWLLLIPPVGIIFAVMIYHGLSKAFGKTEGFTVGLIFLPFVFFPKLGLSHLKYQKNDQM